MQVVRASRCCCVCSLPMPTPIMHPNPTSTHPSEHSYLPSTLAAGLSELLVSS